MSVGSRFRTRAIGYPGGWYDGVLQAVAAHDATWSWYPSHSPNLPGGVVSGLAFPAEPAAIAWRFPRRSKGLWSLIAYSFV